MHGENITVHRFQYAHGQGILVLYFIS